jgi:hypothetical protein
MNAAFFGLAGLAALNPELLIIDLVLATNKRPRLMFLCFLLGGMGLAITVGLVDVFVVHLDAIKTQNHSSAGIDLALGIPLLAVGALLAANHLHVHRRRPHPPPRKLPSELENWALRALHEPRRGLAVLVGLAVGIPGASYLLALHHLVASRDIRSRGADIRHDQLRAGDRPVRVHGGPSPAHRKGDQAVQGLDRQARAAARSRHRRARGRIMVISGILRLLN